MNNKFTMPDFNRRDKFEKGDYYYSEEGYLVFTEQYLLKRGYCCKNNCRHCPYGYNPKTGQIEKDQKDKS